MASPKECDEQAALVEWLELKRWTFTATAQATPAGSMKGGKWTTHFGTLKKNAKLGVRKGFPDMAVITPRGVAFVELKRRDGVPSDLAPEQVRWLEALESSNVEAAACCGAAEAIAFLTAVEKNAPWAGRIWKR